MSVGAGAILISNVGAGNGADVVWPGGHTAMIGEATFGGGNIALHQKLPSGAYVAVTNMSLTAAGMVIGFLPAGTYRAVVTTATAASARLARIPA